MTEMEWEDAPAVHVPLVRNWLSPAVQGVANAMYGRHGRFYVFWWPFLILILYYWLFKLGVFAMIVAALVTVYLVWVVAELATYRHRVKREALREWPPYLGELHQA